MADIELVIKIPDFIYTEIRNITNTGIIEHNAKTLYNVIYNGTPLPKGHGDLIDRDSLELDSDWSDYYDGFSAYSESQVRLVPTIIEGSDSEWRIA